jgi:MFS family permease
MSVLFSSNGFGNLGFYSVGLLYLAWGFSSIISPVFVDKYGIKNSLVLGALANALLIFSCLLTLLKFNSPNT